MLHLVQSNKIEQLCQQLMLWLEHADNCGASILSEQTILVQSPGMAQWLKLQIAAQRGIAANLAFPLPSSFIWQLYRQHIRDLPETSAFTKDNMTWKLMTIVPGMLHQDAFAAVRHYLSDDNPLKLYQFCHKVADVFDQYLMYRPDWIQTWEAGEDDINDTQVDQQPWQPPLWRALTAYTGQLEESPLHRANLHQQLLDCLSRESGGRAERPLLIFGISAIPQQQLEVFAALAQQRDVVIFWANPSEHYWGDLVDEKSRHRMALNAPRKPEQQGSVTDYLDVGNPLLSSWGKLGRDYQDMLLNFDIQQHDDFVDDHPQTLLGLIQREILHLTYRDSQEALSARELLSDGDEYPKLPIQTDDDSLTVQVCHSRTRELEVLHDHLLDKLNGDPSLSPSDIIVMMPDVATYAPYIDGVFGAAEDGLHIPYAISDRSAADESELISCFMQLMQLHHSRMTLSDILAMLEVPAILRRYEISEAEFEQVKHWLVDAGVRWGLDGQDKCRWSLPAEHQNTLLFGLERLLAGYALGESRFDQPGRTVAPYVHIEGQQAVALGKFWLFSRDLLEVLSFCQSQSSLGDKVTGALNWLSRVFVVDDDEEYYLNQLRQTLEEMAKHNLQYTNLIDQDVFASDLQGRLNDKGVGQRFLAGAVNFCTLMPMRSIPFRLVCILGLNDADYPRQTVPLGFDLMRLAKPRKGDRSRRMDDRYLLLEAILSARQQLYFSYQGYNPRDNSVLPPSMLLSELLEYCEHAFCLAEGDFQTPRQSRQALLDHLQQQHRLQPFATGYFQPDAPKSYQKRWAAMLNAGQQSAMPDFMAEQLAPTLQSSDVAEVELDSLQRYFANPARGFFRLRWQTDLTLRLTDINDEEPFVTEGLERFQLIERLTENPEQASLLRAEGLLPGGNSAELSYQTLLEQARFLQDNLRELQGNASRRRCEIDLQFDHTRLTGWSPHIWGQNLVLWRGGDLRVKDKFELWLNWLSVCAMERADVQQACFIGKDKLFQLETLSAQSAREQLAVLLQHWINGHQQVLHFYPKAGWEWLKTGDRVKTLNAFVGTERSSGDLNDPHVARVCPDLDAVFDSFTCTTEALLGPLFEHGGGQ